MSTTNTPVSLIRNTKAFILDMDGTFYLSNQLLPGALEFLDYLTEKGIRFSFLTNNSSRNVQDYQSKLTKLGVPEKQAIVYSSGEAAIAWLKRYHPGRRTFVLGTPSLQQSFLESGIILDEKDPEIVVLGYDTTLTYDRLTLFCDFVRAGKLYIATHPDINCPVEGGYAPDAGAMIALIKASTGREPDLVIGKPNKFIVELLAAKLGVAVKQMTMVGDRLYTDIALGKTAGVQTVLVLSGETAREDLRGSEFQADLVCEDLAELLRYLRES